jgi:hypothetical protein
MQVEPAALRMTFPMEFCYFFNSLPGRWFSAASRTVGLLASVNPTEKAKFAHLFLADLVTRGRAISF